MFIVTRTKRYDPKEILAVSHEGAANAWMREEMYTRDADNCGTDVEYIAVSDGSETKYYKAKAEWWIDYDPEWTIHNEFELNEITREEAKAHDVIDNRDWVFI